MKTEILFLADESGSMHHLKDDANGSFDTFVREQRLIDGECRLTLTKFASVITQVYQARDIKQGEVPKLDLKPSGNTALLDAIGHTMNDQGMRIAQEKWADLVILVIHTDGHENASREFTPATIKSMIQHAEANGWKVIFLANGVDAHHVAASVGSKSVLTRSAGATGQGMHETYSYASAETRSLRTGAKP